jgi:xanthine dehydrogenase YagS FAD-binding subunit
MLTVVNTAAAVTTAQGEIRAGGTDLHDRYRAGISSGPIVDIHKLPGLNTITQQADGTASIGALVTIDGVARHPLIAQQYPGLAQAADGLATPQIRWAATMGGALLQRTRCWFYRHPDYVCFKKGGNECHARDRHNPNGVIFDRGGCVYPHPSTLGMALLAYAAEVEIHGQGRRPIAEIYGDGSDPTCDHLLATNELLTQIHLPPPTANEQAAYFRSISRFEAEWPIIECLVRLVLEKGMVQRAWVGVGGVAPVPMRLTNVEAELIGQSASQSSLEAAAAIAARGTNPFPQTAYKVDFLVGTVLTALEQAIGTT